MPDRTINHAAAHQNASGWSWRRWAPPAVIALLPWLVFLPVTLLQRTFAFGDVRVDFETFEVTVAGEPVRLTQLEMTLLRYFVENESRVIPRAELLEEVWGMPGNLSTRAPDQFMRRLRKALEPDPAHPRHFLTIRDAGYRFLARPDED